MLKTILSRDTAPVNPLDKAERAISSKDYPALDAAAGRIAALVPDNSYLAEPLHVIATRLAESAEYIPAARGRLSGHQFAVLRRHCRRDCRYGTESQLLAISRGARQKDGRPVACSSKLCAGSGSKNGRNEIMLPYSPAQYRARSKKRIVNHVPALGRFRMGRRMISTGFCVPCPVVTSCSSSPPNGSRFAICHSVDCLRSPRQRAFPPRRTAYQHGSCCQW
jgi:hypothetical protein